MKTLKIKYQFIRDIVPYDKCVADVLPYLSKTFTFERFVEQFLLVFNSSKKDIIKQPWNEEVKMVAETVLSS